MQLSNRKDTHPLAPMDWCMMLVLVQFIQYNNSYQFDSLLFDENSMPMPLAYSSNIFNILRELHTSRDVLARFSKTEVILVLVFGT